MSFLAYESPSLRLVACLAQRPGQLTRTLAPRSGALSPVPQCCFVQELPPRVREDTIDSSSSGALANVFLCPTCSPVAACCTHPLDLLRV